MTSSQYQIPSQYPVTRSLRVMNSSSHCLKYTPRKNWRLNRVDPMSLVGKVSSWPIQVTHLYTKSLTTCRTCLMPIQGQGLSRVRGLPLSCSVFIRRLRGFKKTKLNASWTWKRKIRFNLTWGVCVRSQCLIWRMMGRSFIPRLVLMRRQWRVFRWKTKVDLKCSTGWL